MRRTPRAAFTIIELMVVIGIIGVLLALTLPMLSGVRSRGQKAVEINNVRQIGIAWMLYSNANNDMIMPGYIAPNAQKRWSINLEFPDHTDIPRETAAPYPWRLAPYLDDGAAHTVFHDHVRDNDDKSLMTMINEAEEIANEPGFGYNAYHLGGWWDASNDGGLLVPFHVFQNATDLEGNPIQVIARSIAQVRRSDQFIAFCSSTEVGNISANEYRHLTDDRPGSHYVVPPYFADEPQWTGNGPDVANLRTFTSTSVPFNRYTEQVAVFYVDGHVDGQAPGALEDPTMWINRATNADFTFLEN